MYRITTVRKTLLILGCLTLGVASPVQSGQQTQQNIQASSASGEMQDFNNLATIDLAQMHDQVENAIGLAAATVTVTLVEPDTGITPIPWRSNLQPHIQIALPQSWILQRASQIGDDSTPFHLIENIIQQTVPGATFTIEIVETPVIAKTIDPSPEQFAKELVVIIGLFSLLTLGFFVNRRKAEYEKSMMPHVISVEAEANAILNMEFSMAKQTIDAIVGTRKFAVLRAIVSLANQQESHPVVQVPMKQTQEVTHST